MVFIGWRVVRWVNHSKAVVRHVPVTLGREHIKMDMSQTTGPTLAELITERRGERSYGRLAQDCGGYPTAKRLQQLVAKPLTNFPDPDTIRGLVLGLGCSATEITLAAARSAGLPVVAGEDPSALTIAGAGLLPPHAQEALLDLAREMMKLAQVAPITGMLPLIAQAS